MRIKNKKKIELTEMQKLLLQWLCHHTRHPESTAHSTWQRLFSERSSEEPDECVAVYDGLNFKEKIEVELIFSRYIAMANLYRKSNNGINGYEWIDYLAYEEH